MTETSAEASSLKEASLVRAEARRLRVELQLVDAAKVRAEITAAKDAEQAKTARLRALRLAKEATEQMTVAPPKKKVRRRTVASQEN